jgi:hypothetical protein
MMTRHRVWYEQIKLYFEHCKLSIFPKLCQTYYERKIRCDTPEFQVLKLLVQASGLYSIFLISSLSFVESVVLDCCKLSGFSFKINEIDVSTFRRFYAYTHNLINVLFALADLLPSGVPKKSKLT